MQKIFRLIILILSFIIFSNLAFAQNYSLSQTENYNNLQNNDATDYPVITWIEEKNFGRNFASQNIYIRINRLESKLLGANFTNDSLYKRVNRITQADFADDDNIESNYNRYSESFPLGGCYSNNSYSNQYNPNTATSSSSLVNMLINVILPAFLGTNLNNNTGFSNSPYYDSDSNEQRNLFYGAKTRILDDY